VSDFISGNPEKKTWNAVYVSWGGPCHGKFVRGICIFGVGDLNLNKWHGFVIKSFKR
jgi:hypothetical protein